MSSKKKKLPIFERTISLRGGSYSVVIPPKIIEHLGLKGGQQLCVMLLPEKKALIGSKESLELNARVKYDGKEYEVDVMRSLFDEDDLKEIIDKLQENIDS